MQFRLSRYATVLDLEETIVVASGVHLQRVTLPASLGAACRLLARGPVTVEEIAASCPPGTNPAHLVDFLRARSLVVADGADEDEPLRKALRSLSPDAVGESGRWPPAERHWMPRPLPTASLDDRNLRQLPVGLVGGCVLQALDEQLVATGLERGYDVRATHLWPPDGVARLPEAGVEIAILQTTIHPLMTPLWDTGFQVEAAERRRLLKRMQRYLEQLIDEFASALDPHCVGIVHTYAPAAVSPFGRLEASTELGLRGVVAELNASIAAQLKHHPSLRILDEELLVARHGAAALFDDLMFPFGHHGPAHRVIDGQATASPLLAQVLATEYLDLLEIARGSNHAKCVVCDLDGTLWPGVAADDGFGWLDGDSPERWIALGIHQALRVLKQRGILLAVASRGDAAATLGAWRAAQHPLLLAPGDFVDVHIGWGPKSDTIAGLAEALGLAPEAIVFLDDHPAEREEVRRHAPGVRVPDVPVDRMRALLLTDPAFEVATVSGEGRARHATTSAVLRREHERRSATDVTAFLRDLEVRLDVGPAKSDDAPRVAELLGRTTQFTIGAPPLSEREVRDRLSASEPHETQVLRVADRLADYGLCGVCLLDGNEILGLAVSCRVIGLDVGWRFLSLALRAIPGATSFSGRIVRTPRNVPARDVFTLAGFKPTGGDQFFLPAVANLRAPGYDVPVST